MRVEQPNLKLNLSKLNRDKDEMKREKTSTDKVMILLLALKGSILFS